MYVPGPPPMSAMRRDLAEIEPAGHVRRIATRASEAVHGADESLGLFRPALKHVGRPCGQAGANSLLEIRPGLKECFVEQNEAAEIFGRRAEQVAPRRLSQRVTLGALVEQSERDHRVGYQSRRAAIRGDGGGESGVVKRRLLEHVEDSELERGLNRARFGVTRGQRGKFGEIHRRACQCTKSCVT